jgi:cell division protein FtsQ
MTVPPPQPPQPPADGPPGPRKPRRAATERAMRRRERRLGPRTADRTTTEPEKPAVRARRERPSHDRTTRPRREPSTRERRAGRVRRTPAERAGRPTRRRVLIRRWVAVATVLGIAGLVVVLLWTPVIGVRSVRVVGTRDLTPAQVIAAADVRTGTPMLRLDTVGITARVGLLPRVASVDVSRDWPSTVEISVTERDPVGYLAGPGGTHLVDSTGFDYATVTTPPAGLPKIDLPAAAPTDPRTQAIVRVLAALPPQLRGQLTVVGAATPGSVTLSLANGKTIRWGDADESARKAAVLGALMTRPGKIYDVSSPDLPTIS